MMKAQKMLKLFKMRSVNFSTEITSVVDSKVLLPSDEDLDNHPSLFEPLKTEFAVYYTKKEQLQIQADFDLLNNQNASKLVHVKTPDEIFSVTDPCKENLDRDLSRRIQRILKQLNYPDGWIQSKDQKKLFARTLYSKEERNWTAFNCIRYFADESLLSYFVVRRVLRELEKREECKPTTLMDFGAGCGSVALAAKEVFNNSLTTVSNIEKNIEMVSIGKTLFRNEEKKPLITWHKHFDKENLNNQDIVVSAFSLSEISEEKEFFAVLRKMWQKTKRFLVLIESGEPHHSELIGKARDFLLSSFPASLVPGSTGASVVAPCSHDLECPARKIDRKKKLWCQFAQKVPIWNMPLNSALYQAPGESVLFNKKVLSKKTKDSSVAAKDVKTSAKTVKPSEEKNVMRRRAYEHVFRFSYVVLKKGPSIRRLLENRDAIVRLRGESKLKKKEEEVGVKERAGGWGRVLMKPQKNKGHVVLKLCSNGQIETRIITKAFGRQEYGYAKTSKWGDLWPYPFRKVVTEKTQHRKKFLQLKRLRVQLEQKQEEHLKLHQEINRNLIGGDVSDD